METEELPPCACQVASGTSFFDAPPWEGGHVRQQRFNDDGAAVRDVHVGRTCFGRCVFSDRVCTAGFFCSERRGDHPFALCRAQGAGTQNRAPSSLRNPELISVSRGGGSYSDLDLSKPAGISELQTRVRTTAREVRPGAEPAVSPDHEPIRLRQHGLHKEGD